MHDLIIHNYGPGRMVISLHAEVPCEEDMMRSHDRIDCVERELSSHFHANVCIHMDPVDTQNERSRELKTMVEQVLSQLDPRLSFHDFRVVLGETHTNLIFDLVVPFQYPDERGLASELERRLKGSNAICGGNRGTQFFIKDAKKDGIKKGLPDL